MFGRRLATFVIASANPSGVGRNCVAGRTERGDTLTLSEETTLEITDTGQTWNSVPDGPASFSALVAAIDGEDIVVEGDTVLMATLYISDLVPTEEAIETPETTPTATATEEAATTATGAPADGGSNADTLTPTVTPVVANALPNTGNGSTQAGTDPMELILVILAALSATAAFSVTAFQRRQETRG